MTYYKGYIISIKKLDEYIYTDNIGHSYNHNKIEDILLYISNFKNLNRKNCLELRKAILDNISGKSDTIEINNKELIDYFNNYYDISNQEKIKDINNISERVGSVTPIVYELVKDKEGNLFGRELYTKELFPIYNIRSENFDYDIKITKEVGEYRFNLIIKPSIKLSSLEKCENFIVGHKIADLNDFNYYMNKFKRRKFLKKGANKIVEEYKKEIIILSQSNVFKDDFSLEEKEERKKVVKISQCIETTLMEDIEYGLIRLKEINKELYVEYKNKYEMLLTKDIIREELALLLGEIEYLYIFKKRNIESILDFINNLKEEYLNNFINNTGNKTDTDLKKLDKISELFLRIKDKFNLLDQRKVLRNIAFLYLMEVYENKDIISIEELENSYFSSNLKSIIIWINTLIEEDIIECDYLVSLRDDLNVEIVFDCIKNIRFKNKKFKK